MGDGYRQGNIHLLRVGFPVHNRSFFLCIKIESISADLLSSDESQLSWLTLVIRMHSMMR